ncbi:MAG: phospholipase [Calditrichaceae bacterium]|nr:phospholipase [Calditrichia bacterium]NUQ42840.1 phospholipase [Calditrichaceae bacterium]
MKENHLTVPRTARYFTLGTPGEHLREVWFVCHGYGQLAEYFLRNFRTLDDGSRLIAAPEALSRFYLTGAFERIGATWMTREDRLNEINDYVNYLDALYERVFSEIRRESVKVIAFGFSQGTATVCRWISRGAVKVDRLILWAGQIPPELDLPGQKDIFSRVNLTVVLGTEDQYAKPELVAEQEARLKASSVPFQFISFAGGHVIDREALKELARGEEV